MNADCAESRALDCTQTPSPKLNCTNVSELQDITMHSQKHARCLDTRHLQTVPDASSINFRVGQCQFSRPETSNRATRASWIRQKLPRCQLGDSCHSASILFYASSLRAVHASLVLLMWSRMRYAEGLGGFQYANDPRRLASNRLPAGVWVWIGADDAHESAEGSNRDHGTRLLGLRRSTNQTSWRLSKLFSMITCISEMTRYPERLRNIGSPTHADYQYV